MPEEEVSTDLTYFPMKTAMLGLGWLLFLFPFLQALLGQQGRLGGEVAHSHSWGQLHWFEFAKIVHSGTSLDHGTCSSPGLEDCAMNPKSISLEIDDHSKAP